MAYGKIKADAIIRDNGGSDEEITVATIVGLDSGKAPKASPTFTGTVTMPATVALAGQASDITIPDNEAAALEIKEGTNAYVTFQTTDGSEQIEVDKEVVSTQNVTLNAGREVRFADSDSSNYIAVSAPGTVATNSTWILPSDAPAANEVLKVTSVASNNPTLEWATAGAAVGTANEWTAGQRGEVTNIDSSSGVLAIDFDASNNFLCITTENITDINYTNLDADMVGQTGSIFFQYGGAHTVGGWDTETRWIGGTGGTSEAPTFTATSGQCDRVDYIIVGDRDTPSQRSHVRVQMVASLNYAD